MKTKKKSKKVPAKTKNKPYHLLVYVENCSPKLKRFNDLKSMEKFVKNFEKINPESLASSSGSWVDYCIFGVTGEVSFFTEGVEYT